MPSVKVSSLLLILLFINSINAENYRRKYRKNRSDGLVLKKFNDFMENEKKLMFQTKWRTNVWESIVDQKNNKTFIRSFFNNGSVVGRIMNENEIMDHEFMKEMRKNKKRRRSHQKRNSYRNYRENSMNNMNDRNVINGEFEEKPKIVISLERMKRGAEDEGSSDQKKVENFIDKAAQTLKEGLKKAGEALNKIKTQISQTMKQQPAE